MRRPLLALATAALVTAAGCVKKPPEPAEIRKEAIPQVNEERKWAATAAAGDVTSGWLASFHDQQLDALVREAIANNPDLRVGATRVEQAAIAVTLAKARLYPSIGIGARGSTKLSDDLSAGLSGAVFSVSWEIDLWGKLRYARNAAMESYTASKSDFEFARQSIAAETAKGWFTATSTLLERDLAAQLVLSAQERVGLAQERVKVGAGDEQDTADARADVAGYEEAQTQIVLAHEQSLRALELMLGRYPSAELAARTNLPQFPGPVPAGLPLQLLERRPDLIAAERRVAAAFNKVGEAKAARFPTLSLTASGGYLTSSVLQLKDDYDNPSAGLAASLFAPLFQGGALKGQVEMRTAEQRQAVAEYTRLAWRAIGDVETALAAERALTEREDFLRATVSERQRALALEETAFRIGRSDNRAVLSRKLAAVSAQAAVLRLLAARLSQRVDLYLALGGGWDVPPAPETTPGTN